MRKPARFFQPVAAFTLVEVLMATIILTVGFMGLIQAVTICSGMMDQARRQSLATQILDHEIERLRLLPWNNPSSGNDIVGLALGPTLLTIDPQFDDARISLGDFQTPASSVRFTAVRSVSDVTTDLRQVTITVTWVVTSSRRDSVGNPLKFTYSRANSAYLGNNGLNLTYQRS